MFCINCWVVAELLNSGVDVWDSGNEVSISESACVTSDASSFGDSLGITHTLKRLDLPRIIGPICSAEVSKKRFGSTSKRDLRLRVGHSDSSDILEVILILAHHILATNLTFFCNICSGLSTRLSWLGKTTKSLFIFYFIFSWTYFTEGSAGKCHKSQCHITWSVWESSTQTM